MSDQSGPPRPSVPHRHSLRLQGYDYAQAGAYFVTLLAWHRQSLFGEVIGSEMQLNQMGRIVRTEWERTAEIRREVELGAYVVMPNHLHAIIILAGDDPALVRATGRSPLPVRGPTPGSLGAIVAGFKSSVTSRINALRATPGMPVWHRNYYDRIVRDAGEMERIWLYIESNPASWADDQENPSNMK